MKKNDLQRQQSHNAWLTENEKKNHPVPQVKHPKPNTGESAKAALEAIERVTDPKRKELGYGK